MTSSFKDYRMRHPTKRTYVEYREYTTAAEMGNRMFNPTLSTRYSLKRKILSCVHNRRRNKIILQKSLYEMYLGVHAIILCNVFGGPQKVKSFKYSPSIY